MSPTAITLADSVTLPPSTSRPGRGRSRRPRRPPCRWRHRPRGRHFVHYAALKPGERVLVQGGAGTRSSSRHPRRNRYRDRQCPAPGP